MKFLHTHTNSSGFISIGKSAKIDAKIYIIFLISYVNKTNSMTL